MLKVQPLQNQPTLNPKVLSSPTQGLQPPLRVAPTPPPQQIQVQPIAPQPEITSVGTATEQQPYDRLKSAVATLDPTKKQELSAILARGMERGLNQEQMRQVASAYIDQNKPEPVQELPPDRSKGFFGRLGDDLKQRWENLGESSQLVDEGKQGNLSFGLQVGGQLAGAVGDVVSEGLTSAYRTVAPESVEQGVAELGNKIGQSRTVQDIYNRYQGFKENNPSLARNIEAVGNIASIVPIGKGAGLAAGAIERVAPKTAARLGSLGIRSAEQQALRASEEALESALRVTRPTLTTLEKQAAISGGRGVVEGGAIKIAASAKDRAVAEAVKDIVKEGLNPVDNVAAIRTGIAQESIEVGQELLRHDGIFNENQLRSVLAKAKEGSRVVFGTDKTLESAYDAVVDEMIRVSQRYPKKLSGLWNARSEFDDIMDAKFKDAFGDAGDNVRRNALQDVRRAVNDYIADRLPQGNTYKARLKKLTNMYEAKDRIALTAAKVVDKTRLQKIFNALSRNPAVTALAAVGLPATIMSILGSPIAMSVILAGGAYYVGKRLITGKMLRNSLEKVLKNKNVILQISERQAIKEMIDDIPIDTDPTAEQYEEPKQLIE